MKTQKTIRRFCSSCKEMHQLEVYEEDLTAWQNGAYIQSVMPYLPACSRELLVSGVCGSCFDKIFETV